MTTSSAARPDAIVIWHILCNQYRLISNIITTSQQNILFISVRHNDSQYTRSQTYSFLTVLYEYDQIVPHGVLTLTYSRLKQHILSYSIKSKWYSHRFDVVSMCTPPLLLAIAAYRYNNTGVKPFARVKLPRSCIRLWFHKGLDKTIQEVSAVRQLPDIDNHILELCITESERCTMKQKKLCAWTASYHHLEIPLRV